jgi:hypothetical protein
MTTCPHCGHPINVPRLLGLTPSEDIVYAALRRAGQRGVHIEALASLLESADFTTGPKWFVCSLRKKLKPHGLSIANAYGGRYFLRVS